MDSPDQVGDALKSAIDSQKPTVLQILVSRDKEVPPILMPW